MKKFIALIIALCLTCSQAFAGPAQAILVPTNAVVYAVTVGNSGTTWGFSTSSGFGAISPASFLGNTINACVTSGAVDFNFNIDGAHSQNFFSSLIVLTTAGTYRRYLSSGTSGFTGSGPTIWNFGTASSPVFTATGSSFLFVFY